MKKLLIILACFSLIFMASNSLIASGGGGGGGGGDGTPTQGTKPLYPDGYKVGPYRDSGPDRKGCFIETAAQ